MNKLSLAKGDKIRIDGRRTVYTVTHAHNNGVWELKGPRGGRRALVRNIHSGALRLLTPRLPSPRSEAIESVEVVE